MAHGPEIRARVRAAYVYERMSLEAAAEKVAVPYPTARRWKSDAEQDGDDWDRARSAARLSGDSLQLLGQMILEDYLVLHQATVEGVKSDPAASPLQKAEVLSRLADSFTKTMSAVSKASPELSKLAIATDVLKRLTNFTTDKYPEHAAALLDVLEPFAADLARSYG